jgi:hypothetical protein
LESSRALKVGPTTLVEFQINNTSGSIVWAMVIDAASAPTGAGAAIAGCTSGATARPCVAKWYQVPANSTLGVSWSPGPFLALQAGALLACSSSGPFTLTYTAICTFSGEVQ